MVSYEEQVTSLREQLADVLIDEEDWNKAAKTLAGIDLDSGQLLTGLHNCIWHLAWQHCLQGQKTVVPHLNPVLQGMS